MGVPPLRFAAQKLGLQYHHCGLLHHHCGLLYHFVVCCTWTVCFSVPGPLRFAAPPMWFAAPPFQFSVPTVWLQITFKYTCKDAEHYDVLKLLNLKLKTTRSPRQLQLNEIILTDCKKSLQTNLFDFIETVQKKIKKL